MRTAGDGGAYRETLQAKSGLDASWSHSEGGQQDTADGSSNRPQPRQLERRHERSRTISAARPSLLAIASGSATSSTSIATIPRLQRSTSDWSIAARNSNLSSNTRKDSDNTTNSLADSQRPSQDPASSPVSRTTHAFAAYDPRSPREDSNEHNGQPSRNPIDVYDDNSEVFEAVAASSSRSLRRDDRSTLSTSLVDPDDLDGIPSDKEEMVSWPLQGPDLDPRKLLRDQLRRSDSVRSRSFRSRPRTDSARSIQSLSSTDSRTADMLTESRSTPTSGPEEILQPTPQSPPKIQKQPVQLHDRPSLPSRRYFVLTSAGKPVFAR